MRNTRDDMALSLLTLDLIKQIRRETRIACERLEIGSMKICGNPETMAKVAADCRLIEPHGL